MKTTREKINSIMERMLTRGIAIRKLEKRISEHRHDIEADRMQITKLQSRCKHQFPDTKSPSGYNLMGKGCCILCDYSDY